MHDLKPTNTYLTEIEKRHGYRCDAENAAKKMRMPHLLSSDGKKDFDKALKTLQEQYLDHCLQETHDMRVLLRALHLVWRESPMTFHFCFDQAVFEIQMPEDLQAALSEREVKEAEKREKQAKSDKHQGEIEGQQKLGIDGGALKVKDDGSEAEPASECVVKKIAPVPALPDERKGLALQIVTAELLSELRDYMKDRKPGDSDGTEDRMTEKIDRHYMELGYSEEDAELLTDALINTVLDWIKSDPETPEDIREALGVVETEMSLDFEPAPEEVLATEPITPETTAPEPEKTTKKKGKAKL